jgi:hypothetical protein
MGHKRSVKWFLEGYSIGAIFVQDFKKNNYECLTWYIMRLEEELPIGH